MRTTISLALVAGLFLSGCAALVSGPRQKLHFESNPPGASVSIDGTGGITPTDISVRKVPASQDFLAPVTARFSKPGYKDKSVEISRTLNPWFFGNAAWGLAGIPGVIIDASTGSLFWLDDGPVRVDLEPETPAGPEVLPSAASSTPAVTEG